MAGQKKMVEAVTSRDVDFAKWYTDIVTKAELADSPLRLRDLGEYPKDPRRHVQRYRA
jgi:hypothetical protein